MTNNEQREVAIKVKNLSKSFRIPLDNGRSLKGRILGKIKSGYREFIPLDDVSFTIYKGDFFGVVGRNGSGKSTLLKSIAGIYAPTKGKVDLHGLLVPFIELGVGFNPQLTGRENVYLNGALLGFSRAEVSNMYDDIVDFAELHDFMEERLQNYSSGMQVRLAFSIAIRAQGDILLLDEVLAVGDSAFQQKCFQYFAQIKNQGKTVVLVTHSMDSVQRFCNRALMLDSGKIQVIGNTEEVTAAYDDINQKLIIESSRKSPESPRQPAKQAAQASDLKVTVKTMDEHGLECKTFFPENKIVLEIKIKVSHTLTDTHFALKIKNSNGTPVFGARTERPDPKIKEFSPDKPTTIRIEIENIFAEDTYSIDVALRSNDWVNKYLDQRDVANFAVATKSNMGWALRPRYELTINQ